MLILGVPVPDKPPGGAAGHCRSAAGGRAAPGVSTAPLGAGQARAAILLRNSQGLGTSSGSRRLEQSGSAWPLGTHGLQSESSDMGPESGDPLPSAPAGARRVPPLESGSGFTALPWQPFCSAGLLGRSTPGEEGAESSLQPLYHAQLGPFWGQRAALRARRPAQCSRSLTSNTVCLGKDLLVQGGHAEGCGTPGGARLRLPLLCSISL